MDLKLFVYALSGDLVALMSGIGSIILLVLGFTTFYTRPTPRWIVLLVAALCFFLASARVWTTEHNGRESAELALQKLTKPQLEPSIWVLLIAPESLDNSHSLVTAVISIINKGAQSIITDWQASIKFPNGRIVQGEAVLAPMPGTSSKAYIGNDNSRWVELAEVDNVAMQTKSKPIELGGAAQGWIQFYFDVPARGTDQAVFTLSFKDFNGETSSASLRIAGQSASLPPALQDMVQSPQVKRRKSR